MKHQKRNIFKNVGALNPGKSVFDLSYEKVFNCDMGQLIPVQVDDVIPGDVFKMGAQALLRFQPLVAPIMHEINLYAHTFFVPYRILDEDFEESITGGEDGLSPDSFPTWSPTNTTKYSLWDYLGFPVGVDPHGCLPIDYVRRAYVKIFNDYYRDENLQAEVALTNESILIRNWEKDYFTSSLLTQQKGIAPAIPLSGLVPVLGVGKITQGGFVNNVNVYETDGTGTVNYPTGAYINYAAGADGQWVVEQDGTSGYPNIRADLGAGVSADVSDLRLMFQIQKWMERNNRAGSRFVEFLRGHFGNTGFLDGRLSRPEYIGGIRSGIVVSEVLQTSSTDVTSPQGNLAGHGITATNGFIGSYRVPEFGLIMTIMSVMPRTSYFQGINKQWLKRSKYDFYFPEFANLSEQAVEKGEILALDQDATHNQEVFGFQGRYDEHRTKQNIVCADMRDNLNYWTLAREFDPLNPPELNEDFIQCIPRKDIFAVQDEPGLIVEFGNVIRAVRPLPIQAEPGLIDHN